MSWMNSMVLASLTLTMVEGHHEGDDNDSLFKHKHCKS
jgi:hypothetical protein